MKENTDLGMLSGPLLQEGLCQITGPAILTLTLILSRQAAVDGDSSAATSQKQFQKELWWLGSHHPAC